MLLTSIQQQLKNLMLPSSTHWRDDGVESFAKFLEHNLPTYCSDCSFHKPSPLMKDKHFCYPEHLFPSKVLKK